MCLVPAPAVRLKKRRVLSRPGLNCYLFVNKSHLWTHRSFLHDRFINRLKLRKEFRIMGLSINDSVYSCFFFFLTGLHFFHLVVGLFLCCLFFWSCSFSLFFHLCCYCYLPLMGSYHLITFS